MIRILNTAEVPEEEIFDRGGQTVSQETEAAVRAIVEDVRAEGDEAVLRYTRKFDGVAPERLRVSEEEIDRAFAEADPAFLYSLRQAAANISAFHERQKREGFRFEGGEGIVLGQRVIPLDTVGVYVPGGTASYPSTVLMNVIPAKIAGVRRIVMTTPCGRDGTVSRDILAAARVAGVTDIFRIGGAQAVAALAYGTESVPRVDKIVGPGNVYVATAKRMVFGQVDIDMIAGPSEILIVADRHANPAWLAADMLSQAEHDRMATAVLVCDSRELAERTAEELERQLACLPREEIARPSIENNGKIIVAADLMEGVAIANRLAAEHLELCVEDPFSMLEHVRNAGSVFLGYSCPEALGDYLAGPNHTLPTSGTARFSSPLSVDEFIKRSSFICYSREALGRVKDDISRLAKHEGLEGHSRSVQIRFGENGL